MKESMKAYLASRGVEEVSKLAYIVGTFCVIYFMILSPPPQLELSRGTSEAEIAKKDYFSAVAKNIIEKAMSFMQFSWSRPIQSSLLDY